MAIKVSNLKSIPKDCLLCKGQCWDPDQSKRQKKVREFLKGPIPDSCADSNIDGSRCPFQP